MLSVHSLEEKRVRAVAGVLYKALILGTLTSLFAFAPLKSKQFAGSNESIVTSFVEMPESNEKVLWLTPAGVSTGHGEMGPVLASN